MQEGRDGRESRLPVRAKTGNQSASDPSHADEAPVFSHTLAKSDLIRYAGAAGDFHPLHTDDAGAQAAGFPGVFAHGMLSAGFLATAITNWFGIGNLIRYRVRFVAQAWPDVTYHSRISVTDRRIELGQGLVDFECSLRNEDSEPVVTGSGTARLSGPTAHSPGLGSNTQTSPDVAGAAS